MEAEVESLCKSKGVEGGQPEEHLEGDGQEGGVDEGGEDKGKDGKVQICPSPLWLNDQGGQEDAEENNHAEQGFNDFRVVGDEC